MISSLILSAMMAFIIFFFVVLMHNFSIASIVYALFLMFLFVRMTFSEHKKMGSGVIYRRIFQTVFAVGFCIAFISDLYSERGSMAITTQALSNSELPFCHIAIPQVLLPLLVLPKNKELREFHFGFLFFIILASLCELACIYCEWFCPFKLVTEFSPIDSIPSLIATVMFIGLFLGLVVVLPILTKKRTQCSTLCPFGAFASLTDRFSLFQMKIDTQKCTGCMKCASTCSFSAIDIKTIQDKKGHPELTCAKCGECVAACPQKAISYSLRFSKNTCGCGHNQAKPKTAVGCVFQELLHPAQLFRFAAFTFAVIMSSDFMIKSLNLVAGIFGGAK